MVFKFNKDFKKLKRKKELVRDYWHKRFKHILIDEYQEKET